MSRGPSSRTRQRRTPGEATASGAAVAATDAVPPTDVVRDGFVLDFISDAKQVKETPKELVRQRIARALFHEYGISVEDMAADFPVSVGGRRRRVDIAILGVGEAHEPENVQRVVVCRPEPKQNRRGAVKMRDYEQAAQDIAEVKPFFEEIEACRYALWTNGLEFFFLRRKATKFQVDAEPIGDWPPVDESIDDRNVLSRARARRADPEMLRTAFRRCHNFIHGNEGMPKDAALAGDGKGHLYHLNSLEFPAGHLPGVKSASRAAPLGSADVVMTNPPFGSTIPITDANILHHFDLAHVW